MVEPADFRNGNDVPYLRWLDAARLWRVLVQSQMRPASLIIAAKLFQMATQLVSLKTMTWSRHSRRIVPMTRSTYARCHGERRADSTCLIPIAFTCSTNS